MPARNSYTSKVFTSLISDRNSESRGLERGQYKMREGQRSGLSKMGIKRKIINKSIKGK